MRNFLKIVMMVVLAINLSGCASPYPKDLAEKAAKYEKGKITYSEVLKELGDPQGAGLLPNGNKQIAYIDGRFGGTRVDLIFDEKDVLLSKMNTKY